MTERMRGDTHRTSWMIALAAMTIALSLSAPAVAGELRGLVRSVSGEVVTIRCEGGLSPNPGDPVKIGFDVPDVGFVALEGSWKVTLIGPGGEIQASPIAGAHGEPQTGHVALITTSAALPRAPSQQPPPQRGAPPSARRCPAWNRAS